MNPTFRKSLLLLTTLCLVFYVAISQKIELRANAYGGQSYFRGSGARSTAIGINDSYGVYGRDAGFAYSIGLQGQWVTQQKHLLGLGLSFEKLSTKCNTTLPATDIVGNTPPQTEYGVTTFTSSFINVNPFVGQRLLDKSVTLDATIGFDVAFNIKSNSTFTTTFKQELFDASTINAPSIDARPRLQLSAGYKKINVLAGYSFGITNYDNLNKNKAYLQFVQFGVGYKIK